MLKELQRPAKPVAQQPEEKVQKFISEGGTIPAKSVAEEGDHRLTLRIPKWLLDKIDDKRKERVGSISRNLWILEQIEKACKK
jgi:hypothetical protein